MEQEDMNKERLSLGLGLSHGHDHGWRRRTSLVPTSWEDAVRVVDVDESEATGRALAHAFATDALCVYLLDGDDMAGYTDEYRWKLHVDLMTYVVAAHCLRGVVTTIGSDYDAVALWMPPGAQQMDDWWTTMRSGMWRLYYQLSVEGRKRYYDEMLPLLTQTKEEVMGDRDNDCYYLVYIGTKPNARRKGYAGRLIRDMADKADAEGRPIYLESSAERNNSYYRKFGFELKRHVSFHRGRDPVTAYIMVREPQGQTARFSAKVPLLMPAVGESVKV